MCKGYSLINLLYTLFAKNIHVVSSLLRIKLKCSEDIRKYWKFNNRKMESGRIEPRKYLRKFENVEILKNFEILVNFRILESYNQ